MTLRLLQTSILHNSTIKWNKKIIVMRNFTRFTLTLLTLSFLFAGCTQQTIKRYGSVIGLKPEKLEKYKELHANVWPGVLKKIKECNIHNYSIYLGELEEGKYYLFSYLSL